ncbi:hypothetical protein [Bartonella melophagi]|uniref:Uncharacterized protein n=1 Tax=Bartonella melophagi K-2C TaxID=1094557 RepID=J1JS12_9HYPH|nr:hypothetical protein [Bartonella melophagi]EJF87647.1 hypothetical protein ME3_01326 [Bartonella melophagi K-2C]
MSIVFRSYDISVNAKTVIVEDIEALFQEATTTYQMDDKCITLTIKEFYRDAYWVSALVGNKDPYNNQVIDTNTDKLEKVTNPRTKTLVEQNKQFFGFFLPKISTFYASNKKLNNLLVSYYKEHFPQKKVIFKPTFLDSEKFAEKLKIVKKIEMSINHDPHKNPDLVFPSKEVFDIYEAISEPFPRNDIIKIGLSVDLKVQNRNWIRNFFNNFLKNNKVENLRCTGKTQDNFDTVFNTEEFQQQVAVAVEKDENGLYKEDSIQKQIVSQITKL